MYFYLAIILASVIKNNVKKKPSALAVAVGTIKKCKFNFHFLMVSTLAINQMIGFTRNNGIGNTLL